MVIVDTLENSISHEALTSLEMKHSYTPRECIVECKVQMSKVIFKIQWNVFECEKIKKL